MLTYQVKEEKNLANEDFTDTSVLRSYYQTVLMLLDEKVIGEASVLHEYELEDEDDEEETTDKITQVLIDRLDVDESYRNHGYGTSLISYITSYYDHSAYLAPDNENAQRLYDRIGDDVSDSPEAEYFDQGFGVYEVC